MAVAGMVLADDGMGVSMPKNVSAVCGRSSADIAWEAVDDPGLAGYNVYKKLAGTGGFQQINTELVTMTEFVAGGLSSQTAYDFGVTSVDGNGVNSEMSDLATCMTS